MSVYEVVCLAHPQIQTYPWRPPPRTRGNELEKAQEIIVGIQILMHALHINEAVIGIENNKKDAIQVLKAAVHRPS